MTNSKITLKQFYDEFIPYIEIVSKIEAKVNNIDSKLTSYCTDNRTDHKDIYGRIDNKISSRAFGAWLGSTVGIISIILVLIGFIR